MNLTALVLVFFTMARKPAAAKKETRPKIESNQVPQINVWPRLTDTVVLQCPDPLHHRFLSREAHRY